MEWRWTYKPPPSQPVLWRNVAPIRDLPGLHWVLPDAVGNRLVYFSSSGEPQWDYQVRLGFEFSPAGVCQVDSHAMWVTDWRRGRMECRSVFGHLLGRSPGDTEAKCRAPIDICATRRGHLLVADMGASRLHQLDPEGRHIGTIELGHLDSLSPSYVDCCHSNGLVAVADAENGRAAVLGPEGQLVAFLWGSGPRLERPLGVRFDRQGSHVMLCESESGRVNRFSLSGAFVDSLITGGQLKPDEDSKDWRPRGLAIDQSGDQVCVVSARGYGCDNLHCFRDSSP